MRSVPPRFQLHVARAVYLAHYSSPPVFMQYAEEQPRGAPLMGVSIYYMREVTPKGHYGPRGQPERLVWARWECKSPGDEANAAIAEAIQHVRYANNYRSRQPGPQHASVQSTMPDGGEHHPRAPAAVQAHTGIAVASGICHLSYAVRCVLSGRQADGRKSSTVLYSRYAPAKVCGRRATR